MVLMIDMRFDKLENIYFFIGPRHDKDALLKSQVI